MEHYIKPNSGVHSLSGLLRQLWVMLKWLTESIPMFISRTVHDYCLTQTLIVFSQTSTAEQKGDYHNLNVLSVFNLHTIHELTLSFPNDCIYAHNHSCLIWTEILYQYRMYTDIYIYIYIFKANFICLTDCKHVNLIKLHDCRAVPCSMQAMQMHRTLVTTRGGPKLQDQLH